jgi:hypothetical protein
MMALGREVTRSNCELELEPGLVEQSTLMTIHHNRATTASSGHSFQSNSAKETASHPQSIALNLCPSPVCVSPHSTSAHLFPDVPDQTDQRHAHIDLSCPSLLIDPCHC